MGERRPGRAAAQEAQRQQSNGGTVALAPPPEPPPKQGNSLIEFTTIARDDPNEGLVFGDTPEHCSCPHCDHTVVTFIDHEASLVTWLLGFVVWFSLGWMSFWVLPLLWPAFKDVVHHCPRCLNVIARKSRISLPTFRTEVMSFKIGGCAVVLARKYVAILLGLAVTILAVYLLRSTAHLNTTQEVKKGAASMLTWEDFLFDCGPRTSLRHRASTARAFDERFRRRTFKWQGEVRVIREGFDFLFVRTKSVVMLKMYPQRFPKRDLPDIALLFGEERNQEVGMLNPGDWVEFEATMTAHGYRGDPEVMSLWHIAPTTRPTDLKNSVAHRGDERDEDFDPIRGILMGNLSHGHGHGAFHGGSMFEAEDRMNTHHKHHDHGHKDSSDHVHGGTGEATGGAAVTAVPMSAAASPPANATAAGPTAAPAA
eukprot:CAMPEP_0197903052 /NCGR_PEP_ID=MMETSP1439-20131203/55003_1 /TAXON_ID=66791 /ORGANISM="Gonyaulax spinifera, Strain CCMP409" /LENGTH=425 /DNA_ID=CAMNT_0043524139 /DNA_START=51 /DNA_END=1328 /DNA_ORIENTATION=+